MKLYKVPRNSRIDVRKLHLKRKNTEEDITELNFEHIDGMYSYCTTDKGEVVHLWASAEVKVIKTKRYNYR